MGFWTALRFLTILPVPFRKETDDVALGKSLTYFPLVGLMLGVILLGLHYGLSVFLPASVVTALVITALVVLTGAHHLDGFMDTCDGITAGKSREERLAIMSDSKVGAFGIAGAVLLILLKYISLSAAPVFASLLLMPTLSRWAMVSAIFTFPYARATGMGSVFKQGANWQRLILSTVVTLLIAIVLLKWWAPALLASLWLIIFIVARYFRSRLGGLVGDVYGAINEISEVLVLLLVIIIGRLS